VPRVHTSTLSPAFARRSAALILALAVTVMGIAAFSANADAAGTYKQTSCAKLSKKVKKAKGKKKKTLKKQLAACKTANAATKSAFNLVKSGNYIGTRGDGATVNWIICANGHYTVKTKTGGSLGTSTGATWEITSAKYLGKTLIFVLEDKSKGTSLGFGYTSGAWQVGVSRSFGDVESLGPVTRTPAGC
jgi:hypothetical protein